MLGNKNVGEKSSLRSSASLLTDQWCIFALFCTKGFVEGWSFCCVVCTCLQNFSLSPFHTPPPCHLHDFHPLTATQILSLDLEDWESSTQRQCALLLMKTPKLSHR